MHLVYGNTQRADVIKTSRHTACHLITAVMELCMPLALFALTISAFAIGTTEFVI
ncbi:hypothetical protein MJM95_30445, partial [Salmonella enterica subsp. enterica serovar Anatum]|nr:hypothetical protein [Salmonella enterica subsp. enterica serovar Anatum]